MRLSSQPSHPLSTAHCTLAALKAICPETTSCPTHHRIPEASLSDQSKPLDTILPKTSASGALASPG